MQNQEEQKGNQENLEQISRREKNPERTLTQQAEAAEREVITMTC